MSAQVIDFASAAARHRRTASGPSATSAASAAWAMAAAAVPHDFRFWTGASGKRYVHTVYELLDCPALPAANYILVRREPGARRKVLSIGRVGNTAASLNLNLLR